MNEVFDPNDNPAQVLMEVNNRIANEFDSFLVKMLNRGTSITQMRAAASYINGTLQNSIAQAVIGSRYLNPKLNDVLTDSESSLFTNPYTLDQKIRCIKMYKERMPCGLKEAKDAVEAWLFSQGFVKAIEKSW